MKHGPGEFEWDDGTKIVGVWVFGKMEGEAKFYKKKPSD